MGPSKEKTIFREQPSQKIGFRLGLYDPLDEREEVEYVGEIFYDTPEDQKELRRIVEWYNTEFSQKDRRFDCIAVFPIEICRDN